MPHAHAPKPRPVTLHLLMVLYGLTLAVITILNLSGAEHWWLGALNLYLPQALWAVPAAILLVAALRTDRAWIWLPALYLVWALGPIMGFRYALRTDPPAAGAPVRILTCNIKYGLRDSAELLTDIAQYKPQLVLLQDADRFMAGPLGHFFKHWNVQDCGQFVIASRLPLAPYRGLFPRAISIEAYGSNGQLTPRCASYSSRKNLIDEMIGEAAPSPKAQNDFPKMVSEMSSNLSMSSSVPRPVSSRS